MPTPQRTLLPLATAITFVVLTGCPSSPTSQPNQGSNPPTTGLQPVKSTCDCSTFPPKAGCDTECGITTGVVESVTANSVTISVPSISTDASGNRTTRVTERTFAISPEESKQLQTVKQGSRVAVTFHQETNQNILKSIREIPAEPPKADSPKAIVPKGIMVQQQH